MKLKLVSVAVAVASALFVSRGDAAIFGTTTNFSKLTVSLTVYTNAPTVTNSTAEVNIIGKAALGNMQLIRTFAGWNGVTYTVAGASDTNWNGAMLIYDWETQQACIADKTGTNILFYAGDGISTLSTNAFFNVQWIDSTSSLGDGEGPFARTRSTTNPGSDKYTQDSRGFFELFYHDSSDNTDLWSVGASVDHFAQFWDSLGNPTYWSDSQVISGANADQQVVLHNQKFCAVSGSISAIGKRPGTNPVLTQ